MKEEDIPVVEGVLRFDGYGVKMFCQYCRKWHLHGWGEGHVVAHCDRDTPYRKTGYILKLNEAARKEYEKQRFANREQTT